MIKKMFYDTFANIYTMNTDIYAAPERYIPTFRNIMNNYIEVWDVETEDKEKDYRLEIAYDLSEYDSATQHDMLLKYMCEVNNCKLKRLHHFYLPPDKFDEYVKRFNLDK